MVNGNICGVSARAQPATQLEALAFQTLPQIGAAVIANAFILYLMGIEDVTPAGIVGTTTALTVYGVHRYEHWGKGKIQDRKAKDYWRNFTLLIGISGLTSWYLLKYFEYPPRKWDVIRMEAVSVVSIAVANTWTQDS
ncbi:MAG: hypothetical protein KDK76_07855 [Chlamydiia bacterium]|nr:hypothetical protein [Chlamydiia bacterium]